MISSLMKKVKVKRSRYRPGVAQRLSRGLALPFHDRGTRRVWVVSSTPRPHFTPGKDPIPIVHEAGWAPGPVWTDGKSRPHRDSIPDRPARSQSLYRLNYRAHILLLYIYKISTLITIKLHWYCTECYRKLYVKLTSLNVFQGWSRHLTWRNSRRNMLLN